MNRPQANEHPIWAQNYIDQVEGDVFDVLKHQLQVLPDIFLRNVGQADFGYAAGKWTLKEMLGHIIDTERILVYRLLCFARNEQQHLPGFDEDDYVLNARFAEQSLADLVEEFLALRKANMYLFKSLNEEELNRKGTASGREINVRSILYVIPGHLNHHLKILKERYHVV